MEGIQSVRLVAVCLRLLLVVLRIHEVNVKGGWVDIRLLPFFRKRENFQVLLNCFKVP